MADNLKTFVTRCAEEAGLDAPTTADAAKQLLQDGNAHYRTKDGKVMRGTEIIEQAAALVWGRAHYKEEARLAALGPAAQAVMSSLFKGGKPPRGGTDMQRMSRWFVLQSTPVPSPAKQASDGADEAAPDKAHTNKAAADRAAADKVIEDAAELARVAAGGKAGAGRRGRKARSGADLSPRRPANSDAGSEEIEVMSDDVTSPPPSTEAPVALQAVRRGAGPPAVTTTATPMSSSSSSRIRLTSRVSSRRPASTPWI